MPAGWSHWNYKRIQSDGRDGCDDEYGTGCGQGKTVTFVTIVTNRIDAIDQMRKKQAGLMQCRSVFSFELQS